MPLRRVPDPDGPGGDDMDELHAEHEMMLTHLAAINRSTSGISAALETAVGLGDTSLAYHDEEGGLIASTLDGEDLFAETDAIERAVRNAQRIIQHRLAALEQGE